MGGGGGGGGWELEGGMRGEEGEVREEEEMGREEKGGRGDGSVEKEEEIKSICVHLSPRSSCGLVVYTFFMGHTASF